ncbi:MAG TPA: aspartyl protease family protein [Terracidiphilus sp.]|nr:aspartyl protease family protein [Terracidiphilus sp.]
MKFGLVVRSLFLLFAVAPSVAVAQQSCPGISTHPDSPAVNAYAQGNYKLAEELYSQELAQRPKDAMLSAALVQTWLREGEVDKAAAQAAKSLADNPGSAIALTAQAEVEFHRGQPWLALTTLAAAAKADPCYARIHFVRSRILRIDSQYASERAEVQAAHEIDPNDPDIRNAWLSTVQVAKDVQSLHQSLAAGSGLDPVARQRATQTMEDELSLLSENTQTCKATPTVTQNVSLPLAPAIHEMRHAADIKRDYGTLWHPESGRETHNSSGQLIGYKLAVDFGQSQASLIVDTAASGVTITRALADANGFAQAPNGPPGTVYVDELKIGPLEFKDCTVGVTEAPVAGQADGFIGTDMFAFSLIDLDQPAGKLTLSQLPSQSSILPGDRPGSGVTNPLPSELEGFTPVYHRKQYLLVPVTLDGHARRLFALDSGMLLSTLSSGVAHEVSATKVNFTNSAQTTSGSTLQLYRDAFDFQFASLHLPHQSHIMEFDPVAVQQATGIQIAGLLGFDILKSVRMQIDYRDGLIQFTSAKFESAPQKNDSGRPRSLETAANPIGPDSIRAERRGKGFELSLTALKNEPEADVLRDLSGVELVERMSTQQLQRWKAAMPGEQSRKVMIALADASAFLNLPEEELPKAPPLDKAAQQQLLAQMNTYVDTTMARLPNFFARQTVSTFEAIHGMRDSGGAIVHQPMHYVGFVTTDVRYHNGKEVMATHKGEVDESDQVGYKLLFSGQFGPVLNTILADAEHNKLSWSHWEPGNSLEAGPGSPLAVFRYSVPRRKSHTTIKVIMPGNKLPSVARPGYHGEIAVDPSSGAILRLTIISDLTTDDPMSTANLMVEYGPVELGGQTYICPIRSVTLETVKAAGFNQQIVVNSTGSPDLGTGHDTSVTYTSMGDVPSATLLNDLIFDHYQILRSDFQIIVDPDAKKEQN